MKILVVGGGNMGLTYVQSFLRSHITNEEDMMILEKSPEKAAQLSTLNIGSVFGQPKDCLQQADLIILAVKPQDTASLFNTLRPYVEQQQVYLSIMAGVKMESIRAGLKATKIIRAMPNLPAQIGMGMTTYTATDEVTRIELVMVQNLLNTTGKTIYVEHESAIDATTAISGSGPAYVFYFMDAMMSAAREMGFSASEAELLVGQTFRGTVELYNKSSLSCQKWIDKVTSKGGTTEAAMSSYQNNLLREHIIAGAKSALERAVELGHNR